MESMSDELRNLIMKAKERDSTQAFFEWGLEILRKVIECQSTRRKEMEAKDTVIRYEQEQAIKNEVERAYKKKKGYDKMGLNWAYTDEDRRMLRIEMEQAVQQAQAEISFKAGRKAEREWAASNQYRDEQMEEAKQAGIREVVEFVETNTVLDGYNHAHHALKSRWQAKLKEWGL